MSRTARGARRCGAAGLRPVLVIASAAGIVPAVRSMAQPVRADGSSRRRHAGDQAVRRRGPSGLRMSIATVEEKLGPPDRVRFKAPDGEEVRDYGAMLLTFDPNGLVE